MTSAVDPFSNAKDPVVMNAILNAFARLRQRSTADRREFPPASSPLDKALRARRPSLISRFQHFHRDDPNPKPQGFNHCGEDNLWWALGAKVILGLLLLATPLGRSQAAVNEVRAIGLTVGDLDRELDFFTEVLPFELVSEATTTAGAADDFYGLRNTETRSVELTLGEEHVTLTQHLTNRGNPIPQNSQSYDHWFQHMAIVVRDMDRAYEQLRQHRVKHVSTAPQTLPAWNKNAGGIKAFYFRDPEDHVIEIIWFPPGKGNPKWQRSTDNLFLGIDHTAIVVSDTDQSLAFYRDRLGMKVVGTSENCGVEQEHLNQVFGARLRITALRAERGPGVEFLEYITPPGGRRLPAEARASDLVFWHTLMTATDFAGLLSSCRQGATQFVSTRVASIAGAESKPTRGVIVRDPDGHAIEFVESIPSDFSAK
jgi:catechol 2,3-dioxygenase-like lactoylglutathione lyase family enzyme